MQAFAILSVSGISRDEAEGMLDDEAGAEFDMESEAQEKADNRLEDLSAMGLTPAQESCYFDDEESSTQERARNERMWKTLEDDEDFFREEGSCYDDNEYRPDNYYHFLDHQP